MTLTPAAHKQVCSLSACLRRRDSQSEAFNPPAVLQLRVDLDRMRTSSASFWQADLPSKSAGRIRATRNGRCNIWPRQAVQRALGLSSVDHNFDRGHWNTAPERPTGHGNHS
jgi:hypothetical protein